MGFEPKNKMKYPVELQTKVREDFTITKKTHRPTDCGTEVDTPSQLNLKPTYCVKVPVQHNVLTVY